LTETALSDEKIKALFTTNDASYRFSRWGREVAPVVFGVDDETLTHLKDAMAHVVGIANQKMAETDPELGANLMMFFCQDWDDLDLVPNLDKLLPDFDILKASLKRTGANQYRTFSFDEAGAIKLCVMLLRYDETMADTSIQALGTGQMLQTILLWGDNAFDEESPIAIVPQNGMCIVKPAYAALVRAAYDAALPASANDASHAMRLAARAELLFKDMMDET